MLGLPTIWRVSTTVSPSSPISCYLVSGVTSLGFVRRTSVNFYQTVTDVYCRYDHLLTIEDEVLGHPGYLVKAHHNHISQVELIWKGGRSLPNVLYVRLSCFSAIALRTDL